MSLLIVSDNVIRHSAEKKRFVGFLGFGNFEYYRFHQTDDLAANKKFATENKASRNEEKGKLFRIWYYE